MTGFEPKIGMRPDQLRTHRINTLNRTIHKAGSVDLDKLINECLMKWGLTRKKLIEYLKILEARGFIEVDGNVVRPCVKGQESAGGMSKE